MKTKLRSTDSILTEKEISMPYTCNRCKKSHSTGKVCSKPIFEADKELIKVICDEVPSANKSLVFRLSKAILDKFEIKEK